TVERETRKPRTFSDAEGRKFRSENGASPVATSGVLEQLGNGRKGSCTGYVLGACAVLVAQPRAGTGLQQALHQSRIAVAAGDNERGVAELVLYVLVGASGEQPVDDLHGARVRREQQRRIAPRRVRLEPRPFGEHEIHDRSGAGTAGGRECALPGGIRVVGAGTMLQEQPGGLELARVCRVPQRGATR